MANEKFTQLPTISNASNSDIIALVQSGVSSQGTLDQVSILMRNNIILHNAGNPNGQVAGSIYQLCWDTTSSAMYVCSTSGTALTAVWKLIVSGSGFIWRTVNSTSQTVVVDYGYIANSASLVTFTLPTTSVVGDAFSIIGKGAGGWSIVYGTSQYITIGSSTSTVTSGSVSSTNRYDSLTLIWGGLL